MISAPRKIKQDKGLESKCEGGEVTRTKLEMTPCGGQGKILGGR